MNVQDLKGNVSKEVPVHSVRIKVGRSIDRVGLSPGITKEQRNCVEALMKKAFLTRHLGRKFYPLAEMNEKSDMIIFSSCMGIGNYKLLAWREIGQKGVEYSIMIRKLSWSGLMKKTS